MPNVIAVQSYQLSAVKSCLRTIDTRGGRPLKRPKSETLSVILKGEGIIKVSLESHSDALRLSRSTARLIISVAVPTGALVFD